MAAKKIANNYTALAKHAEREADVPDSAQALVGFYARRGQLDTVRTSLARGVLQRNRPEELTWLFGSEAARDLGFSLTMDVRPSLGVTPLTWAIGHRRRGLFDHLLALGADPTYRHPEGTNAWRHLVAEAPLHQAPPLALMARMTDVGVPFSFEYHHSALQHVFSRRRLWLPNGRPQSTGHELIPALAWADALLAQGWPALATNELGQTLHHFVLGWAGRAEAQDPRHPWLVLLQRYGGLTWDQPDHRGQTPRALLAGFPELQARLRAEALAIQAPSTSARPRRRA